jgi:hypothetical protein
VSFTDGKPFVLSQRTVDGFKNVRKERDLACEMCGKEFIVGDDMRWVLANSYSPSTGNFFVCATCDGPDLILRHFRWMLEAATRFRNIWENPPTASFVAKVKEAIRELESQSARPKLGL